MKIKHSKYKNAGILFELLVRQITADTLFGKKCAGPGGGEGGGEVWCVI